mmetsp:Transcript_24236/g.63842  ORF Transcript_24236/g.63842 Transcript_24236/m.63842 type:complete len:275 (+) Transcript_24236:610-1434(+)
MAGPTAPHLLMKASPCFFHVLYDAMRVVPMFAKGDTCILEHTSRCGPWHVDVAVGECHQLRHKAPHIAPIGIHVLCICHGVALHRCEPLTDARQALVLPHHAVDRAVGVGECDMEPFLPLDPRNSEHLDQELPYTMPHVLLHVPRGQELSHGSVHGRISSFSIFPGLQSLFALGPWQSAVDWPHRRLGEIPPIIKHPVAVVAPCHAPEPLLGLWDALIQLPVDVHHAQEAESEVSRKLGLLGLSPCVSCDAALVLKQASVSKERFQSTPSSLFR